MVLPLGVKFDFPFKESLLSMLPLVDKIFINVGIGEDGTLEEIKKIPKVEIIEVDWDDRRSDAGHILSDMTNVAIKKMRESVTDPNAWAIYLQSDEVLHEDDLEMIKNDIRTANDQACDTIAFRYMHFWQRHDQLAIGKRWYPQEIRAFKINTPILSHGDAQTFSGHTKTYNSDSHIWHYGHVRDERAYKIKMEQMSLYYQRGFKHYRKKFKAWLKDTFTPEITATFLGQHPKVMHKRIERLGGVVTAPKVPGINLVGDLSKYSPRLLQSINADSIQDPNGIKVDLNKIKFQKSLSPICREWTNDFKLVIELSRHNIGFKN